MLAKVTIEVPEGTDVTDVVVYLRVAPRTGPQRKELPPVHLVLVPPPEPAPQSPQGPQLWLRYAGWVLLAPLTRPQRPTYLTVGAGSPASPALRAVPPRVLRRRQDY